MATPTRSQIQSLASIVKGGNMETKIVGVIGRGTVRDIKLKGLAKTVDTVIIKVIEDDEQIKRP